MQRVIRSVSAAGVIGLVCGAAMSQSGDSVTLQVRPSDFFTFEAVPFNSTNYPDIAVTSDTNAAPGSATRLNLGPAYAFRIGDLRLTGTGAFDALTGGMEVDLQDLLFGVDGLFPEQGDQETVLLQDFVFNGGAGRDEDGGEFAALDLALDGTIGDILPEEILPFLPLIGILPSDPFSLSLFAGVRSDGVVEFSVTNIALPVPGNIIGTLTITNLDLTLETLDLPPQITEFDMNGDFERVADSTGGAVIRYLDDDAFAPFLVGELPDATPEPMIPSGITEAQDGFATTTSLGIPGPGGQDDTVYITSVPRNETTAIPAGLTESDLSRTIGLSFWPNSRPGFPSPIITNWSFVMDVFIPQSTFDAAQPVVVNDNVPEASGIAGARVIGHLLNDEPDGQDAGLITLYRGADGPDADTIDDIFIGLRDEGRFGPEVDGTTTAIPTGITPGTWNRVAFTNRFLPLPSGTRTSFSVNGELVYEIVPTDALGFDSSADILFTAFDPRPGERFFPASAPGEDRVPVTDAQFAAWGGFPNPFAQSCDARLLPGEAGACDMDETAVQLLSTTTLFNDGFQGQGGELYIANIAFVDAELTTQEISDLGAPTADGIFFNAAEGGCNIADLAEPFGSLNAADVNTFVNAFLGMGAAADIAEPIGTLNAADVNTFVNAFLAGCP